MLKQTSVSRPRPVVAGAAQILLALAVACCVGSAVAAPATTPTTQATRSALGNGMVDFAPPGDYAEEAKARTATRAVYVSKSPEAIAFIEVLPADAEVGPGASQAIATRLRQNRQKNKEEVVMAPKAEADARFAMRIHEKYKAGERVADVLYLYRRVGPRVVMVRVDARAEGEADVKAIHAAGEAMCLSAGFVKPTPKKPAKK